jgi:2-hydroxychromene-2-carboxylate isomerase
MCGSERREEGDGEAGQADDPCAHATDRLERRAMPTFYYDLGSPYAWLTAERIQGATWVPVLLGGIFRAVGRSSWARTDARAAGIAEIERRARERGLPAPRWPDEWPNDGLVAMRAAAHAGSERFALEAFRVHFVDGLALSDPANVALAAGRAGLDGEQVLAATREQAVKDRLRANTEQAIAAGVIGVPSLVDERGEVLFGDDVIP